MKIHYNPKLKQLSRNLRNQSTLAEVLLWAQLNKKQRSGYKFNRQKPIGNYIVDFYCSELNLVIEIDGESHYNKEVHDKKRQLYLESLGLRVIRFDDDQVKQDMDGVLSTEFVSPGQGVVSTPLTLNPADGTWAEFDFGTSYNFEGASFLDLPLITGWTGESRLWFGSSLGFSTSDPMVVW